jgi:hypothetical protein
MSVYSVVSDPGARLDQDLLALSLSCRVLLGLGHV